MSLIKQLEQRAHEVKHPLAKKLLNLAVRKKTNLCLSLDVTQTDDFLKICEQLGPYIAMLKTHIDIIDDFSPRFIDQVKNLAAKHDFLLFEDRKFADIGNTAKFQYAHGIYHIASWADFVTVHALTGEPMIEALSQVGLPLNRGCFMLVQLSGQGNLLNSTYQQEAIAISRKHPEFVAGFIAQERFSDTQDFICCTPGINLVAKGDSNGQQYKTPLEAMAQGSDILIVGRGLYQAQDPIKEAEKYLAALL